MVAKKCESIRTIFALEQVKNEMKQLCNCV